MNVDFERDGVPLKRVVADLAPPEVVAPYVVALREKDVLFADLTKCDPRWSDPAHISAMMKSWNADKPGAKAAQDAASRMWAALKAVENWVVEQLSAGVFVAGYREDPIGGEIKEIAASAWNPHWRTALSASLSISDGTAHFPQRPANKVIGNIWIVDARASKGVSPVPAQIADAPAAAVQGALPTVAMHVEAESGTQPANSVPGRPRVTAEALERWAKERWPDGKLPGRDPLLHEARGAFKGVDEKRHIRPLRNKLAANRAGGAPAHQRRNELGKVPG